MVEDYRTIDADAGFTDVVESIAGADFPHLVVLEKDGGLAGYLSMRDLRGHLSKFEESKRTLTARDIMTADVITIGSEANLEDALHRFEHRDISALPVVDRLNPRHVVGLLRRDDVYDAYERKIFKERLLSVPYR
jgi:CIC family chloride channel protein